MSAEYSAEEVLESARKAAASNGRAKEASMLFAYANRIKADDELCSPTLTECPRCKNDHAAALADPKCTMTHPPAQAARVDDRLSDELRSFIEGMSVSVDVSTGDADDGHRYFGTVTEVMDCTDDKHGVTLLVQDAEPNFKAGNPVSSAAIEALRDVDHVVTQWRESGREPAYGQWLTLQDVVRSALAAEPVAQADGMCNADSPARRCVCREEFGRRVCEPGAQGEAAQFPMTEQQVRQWIDACNHEPSRQVLRDYLRLREAQPRAVPGNCLPFTNEVIDKMQDVMADHGFTVPARVISDAFRTTRVALLAAAPSPGESE